MSNDVNFVIGGKDKLSPPLQAAGKSLSRFQKQSSATAKTVEKASQAAASAHSAAMASMVAATASAVNAAVQLSQSAVRGVQSAYRMISAEVTKANAAFDEQYKSVRLLNSALKIRGDLSGRFSAAMQREAKIIEESTGILDNQVMALMHEASMLGIIPDRIDDAAKAAIGLSRVTGKDLNTSLGMVTEALKGNFEAFRGIKPEIQWMRTNQEKFAAVMEIVNQGMADQQQSLSAVDGATLKSQAAWASLYERIGDVIEPVRVLGIELSTNLATSLLNLVPTMEQVEIGVLALKEAWRAMAPDVVASANAMIAGVTMVEVVTLNLGKSWEAAKLSVQLSMVAMAEDAKHLLTVAIPTYAVWFAQNFTKLIDDAMNAATAIVANGVTNVTDAFNALWEFLATGDRAALLATLGEIAGRSYLDGFTASVGKLPEIAARELTKQEEVLAGQLGRIALDLGTQFADKFSSRIVRVGDVLEATIGDGVKKGLTANKMNIDLKAMPSIFAMQGVQAQQGRLLTRGPASTLQQQMLDLMKRQLKVQEDGTRAAGQTSASTTISAKEIAKVAVNTSHTVQMVPVQ